MNESNGLQWGQAQTLIELTRELLDTEVTALSLESYQRAYPVVVCVQVWISPKSFFRVILRKSNFVTVGFNGDIQEMRK
jgi:hypothetical protein